MDGEGTTSILVVEDDEGLRFALREGLSERGFSVRSAADAAEAYRLADEAPSELILLDWVLPGESGVTICRTLRASNPGVPIVMFTGLADVRDQRVALEAGATSFLRKGMALDDLAAELRRALGDGQLGR